MIKKIIIVLILLFATSQISQSADSYISTVITDDGEYGYNEIIDLPALSETALLNVSIATASLVANGTNYANGNVAVVGYNTVGFTQITYPRNVSGEINFLLGTATSTVSGTMTIYGYDNKGHYTSEAITISTQSTDGTASRAWVWIDTITLSGFTMSGMCGNDAVGNSISTCTVRIGVSNKIGVWGDLRSKNDVYKVTRAYVDVSTNAYNSTNATYDTIDLSDSGIGTVPDGSVDYRIWFKKNVWHDQSD